MVQKMISFSIDNNKVGLALLEGNAYICWENWNIENPKSNRETKTKAKPHQMKAYLLKMAPILTTKMCTYDTQRRWGIQ